MTDKRTADGMKVERAYAAEVVASALRHEVRNKLASTRNAVTYIRRKLESSDAWDGDERIARFFELAMSELDAADEVLDERIDPSAAFGSHVGVHELGECARRGATQLQVPSRVELHTDFGEQTRVRIDPEEAALLVRCLVENALEANEGSGRVTLRVQRQQQEVVLEVTDDGPGLDELTPAEALRAGVSTKSGRVGLGLAMAARVARRYLGSVELDRVESETIARVRFPAPEDET